MEAGLEKTGTVYLVAAGAPEGVSVCVAGPVLAASSTSEMLYRSQWSRSGLSECISPEEAKTGKNKPFKIRSVPSFHFSSVC